MANIVQERVVVTFSRIVKKSNEAAVSPLVTPELLSAIEMMSEQLVGDVGAVVEVTQDDA